MVEHFSLATSKKLLPFLKSILFLITLFNTPFYTSGETEARMHSHVFGLVLFLLNVPVNNITAMSGQGQRFMG